MTQESLFLRQRGGLKWRPGCPCFLLHPTSLPCGAALGTCSQSGDKWRPLHGVSQQKDTNELEKGVGELIWVMMQKAGRALFEQAGAHL